MDLLFTRYAGPFSMLDNIIQWGGFSDFIETLYDKEEEKTRWEFYLHKLSMWDNRSWDEFNRDLDSRETATKEISDADKEDIVRSSYDMLKDFDPGRG